MLDQDFDPTVLEEAEAALADLQTRLSDFATATHRLDDGQKALVAVGVSLTNAARAHEEAARALTKAATAVAAAAPDETAGKLAEMVGIIEHQKEALQSFSALVEESLSVNAQLAFDRHAALLAATGEAQAAMCGAVEGARQHAAREAEVLQSATASLQSSIESAMTSAADQINAVRHAQTRSTRLLWACLALVLVAVFLAGRDLLV